MSKNIQGDTIVYCRASLRTRMLDPLNDGSTTDRVQAALDAQLRQCEEFAVQLGYKIVDHIEDTSEGADIERDRLYDLYTLVKERGITRVLVSDGSRLAPDPQSEFAVRCKLAEMGVEVIYAMM